MERRLSAILAADVVGYSKLIGRNEDQTIRALKAHIAVLAPIVGHHSGRVFKSTGDGFLAEFQSAVDAINCAEALQRQMAARNASEEKDMRLDFRMGVHAADVVVDGEDILGDGVNIAARLEGVAAPGGVAISAQAREDVVGKVNIEFLDIGLVELKNIAQPVHVYSFGPRPAAASVDRISPPEKPSIAVLAFDNMSIESEDDYFADGITEDIITALSHVPSIFVIARNSSFIYRGLSVDLRRIGQELGVRYLLEGSVRRSGNRIRITAQLIDAETAAHLWARRFDGVLEDIFDLQDEVSAAVVTAIAPEIQTAEIRRGLRKPPDNLDGYDMFLRGLNALHLVQMEAADAWLSKAVEIAPDFAKARAFRGWIGTVWHYYGLDPMGEFRRDRLTMARQALAQQPGDPEVMAYAGYTVGFLGRELERGLGLVEAATKDCPSFAWAWASSALLSAYLGRPDQALARAQTALRLSPRDPFAFRTCTAVSLANIAKGDHEGLLASGDKGIALNVRSQNFHYHRAIALAGLGRMDEAAAARQNVLQRNPDFRIGDYLKYCRLEIGISEKLNRPLEAGLRQAGFPE